MSVAGWLLSLLCISAGAVYDEAHVLEPDDNTDDQRRMVQMLLQMDIRYHGGKHNQSHLVPDCTLISTPMHKVKYDTDYDLAPHNVKCPSSTYMRYWKLVLAKESMAFFEVMCCKVACVSEVTRTRKYLHWPVAACRENELMQQWRFIQSPGKMEMTCCVPIGRRIESKDCKTIYPEWMVIYRRTVTDLSHFFGDCGAFGENWGLQYIDMNDLQVGKDRKLRVFFGCCPWFPPPTPPPTPSPTPSPPTPSPPTPSPTPSPPTPPVPPLLCGEECKLKFDGLPQNPFANFGEWTTINQSNTLKFMNACMVDGTTFDLQMVIPPGYRAKPGRSRVQGDMYKLNMAVGNNVSIAFTLLQGDQIADPAKVKSVLFSILDLDAGRDTTRQWLMTPGINNFTKGREVVMNHSAGGGPKFIATRQGNSADNPASSMNLSPEALSSAVALQYTFTAQWTVTFGIDGGDPNGRFFYLAGSTALQPTFCPR